MAFTVSRPGGPTNLEFETYFRLLEQAGVDVARTPRAPEPEARGRWLPAWTNRPDAERFAEQLRKATRGKSWKVYSVEAQTLSEGPLGPIDIYMGEDSEGCTYALHPNSRKLVRMKYPRARMLRSVFIGPEPDDPLAEPGRDAEYSQVAKLLTGLTAAELQQFGGFRVYDVEEDAVLWSSFPSLSGAIASAAVDADQ